MSLYVFLPSQEANEISWSLFTVTWWQISFALHVLKFIWLWSLCKGPPPCVAFLMIYSKYQPNFGSLRNLMLIYHKQIALLLLPVSRSYTVNGQAVSVVPTTFVSLCINLYWYRPLAFTFFNAQRQSIWVHADPRATGSVTKQFSFFFFDLFLFLLYGSNWTKFKSHKHHNKVWKTSP